jgi:hypothetical protein
MTETKFKKGQKSGPGRPKGSANKVTKELKGMILAALDTAGGEQYLVERANDPKTASAFLTLVGKVLPMTLAGDPENPVRFQVIERRIVKAGN